LLSIRDISTCEGSEVFQSLMHSMASL